MAGDLPNQPAQSASLPSPWVVRHGAGLGPAHHVLDVACGGGRHIRHFLQLGCHVTGVDRIPGPLSGENFSHLQLVRHDLEDGSPWPFGERTFDAVIVTNYLHRPLMPILADVVTTGGLLIYETFAEGNERYGRPSNPRFLLRRGELLDVAAARFRVLAFEDRETPRPARVQRIAAIKEPWP